MIWIRKHAKTGELIGTPTRATKHSVGYDLTASHEATVGFGWTTVVETQTRLTMPPGTFGMVCPRSGLAAKHGITVVNAPGIIDPDYDGTIKVVLTKVTHGDPYTIRAGDKIAQVVIAQAIIIDNDNDTLSTRNGGLGSTGD